MSGKEEQKVQKSITNYLDSLGAYYLKVHGSAFQPSGTPDLLACVNGKFVGIEVKKPKGGITSELQKFKIKQIKNAGGHAFVANGLDVVKREFKKHNIV